MVDKVQKGKPVAENEGSSRIGLLTEKERVHLQGSEKISDPVLTKICWKLDTRLREAIKDLKIMNESPHLRTWRARHSQSLDQSEIREINDLVISIKNLAYDKAYLCPVKYFGRKEDRKYWLDLSQSTKLRTEKIFDPKFALRKIRNETVKEDLVEPLKADIIPYFKEDALTLTQIKENHKRGIQYQPNPAKLIDSIPDLAALKKKLDAARSMPSGG